MISRINWLSVKILNFDENILYKVYKLKWIVYFYDLLTWKDGNTFLS